MSTRNPASGGAAKRPTGWTKQWEEYSGKKLGETNWWHELLKGNGIGKTIKEAQDVLCRLYLGTKFQEGRDYARRALKAVAHVYDMSPPKTLGELCLELAQNEIMDSSENDYLAYLNMCVNQTSESWPIRRDIQDLRRTLYRRNTDPLTTKLKADADYFGWLQWKQELKLQEHQTKQVMHQALMKLAETMPKSSVTIVVQPDGKTRKPGEIAGK